MDIKKNHLALHIILIIIVFCVNVFAETIPDWTSVTIEPFNLIEPATIVNPILTAGDIDDFDATFVADPFLFFENNVWYMFFEVLNTNTDQGDIALATSVDGFHWSYEQVVLDESFHLSYPYVFKWQNSYYMIPETKRADSVRLYKSAQFPYEWELESILLDGIGGLDSSVFYFDGKWWMFTSPELNKILDLYYADNLNGPWTKHPMSPIVAGDASLSRPGGRSFVFDENRIIRVAQKSDVVYGQQVRAFEVDVLTETQYEEHEILESPILTEGTGWNETGMHQFDPWWTGSYWLCAVDGKIGETWSIGIYVNDADTDNDGVPDYIDGCIDDPNKDEPGICGCGVVDNDSDGDGIPDCVDSDNDNDGLPDTEEQGTDGNDPNYDGNDDGVADRLQSNVTSIHSSDGRSYVTLASPVGTSISNLKAIDKSSLTHLPSDVGFPYGFFQFIISGISDGDATVVNLYLPDGEVFDTYFKYGPTLNTPSNHWYEFLYDDQTGAMINGNIITLHFIDGIRGDDDLTANGTINDIGGPGIILTDSNGDDKSPADNSSGGGGGGCFISIASDSSVWVKNIKHR
jgi:hypothetical protein